MTDPARSKRQLPHERPQTFREAFDERDRYRAALKEIATRPTVERNPDGVDQAAHTMRLIAREALGLPADG